jgi:hypothetical protein
VMEQLFRPRCAFKPIRSANGCQVLNCVEYSDHKTVSSKRAVGCDQYSTCLYSAQP